jgi:hypothetical protein
MELKHKVGRSVLVVVALGYASFFAVNLMKPHSFTLQNDSQMKATSPTFVATTPATARLPELGEQLQANPSAPSLDTEVAKPVEVTMPVALSPEISTGGNEQQRKSELSLDRTTPNANKFRNKQSHSINDDLGMEIIQAADETIADASHPSFEMTESMLKSLGISKRQYATIKMREKRLTQQLRAADERGSDGFKRILKTDHSDWMKEYLGPIRYQRFMEIAGNS